MWIGYIVAMALIDTVYVSIAKYWSLHMEKWYLPLFGFIALLFTNIFFMYGLVNGSGLARGVMWFGILSSIFATVIAVIFFKEHLTYVQWMGLVLGVVAIVLLK